MERAIARCQRQHSRPYISPAVCEALKAESTALRKDILEALYHSGGGHYGGCLSVLDIILALYRIELRVSPADPLDAARDRFILSKGHAALALYAVLRRLGFALDPLNGYATFASSLEGHPDMTTVRGVDFSTGSLGQGLSVGVGMAFALKRASRQVWVVVGDGECQEGQIWEAAMLAESCGLDNLHVVVDHNRFQEWGRCGTAENAHPAPVPALAEKWRAFGWRTVVCDGHDYEALAGAFATVRTTVNRPSAIIAETIKGKGVSILEAQPRRFHCESVSTEEHHALLASLASQ